MRKTLVGVALCAAAVLGTGSAAFAGEVTGSGKGGPVKDPTAEGFGQPGWVTKGHASECAFSGLNDDRATQDAQVQNFGHRHEDPFFLEFTDESHGASQVTVFIDVGPPGGVEVTIGCNKHAGADAPA
jgi:hypothetical protein